MTTGKRRGKTQSSPGGALIPAPCLELPSSALNWLRINAELSQILSPRRFWARTRLSIQFPGAASGAS